MKSLMVMFMALALLIVMPGQSLAKKSATTNQKSVEMEEQQRYVLLFNNFQTNKLCSLNVNTVKCEQISEEELKKTNASAKCFMFSKATLIIFKDKILLKDENDEAFLPISYNFSGGFLGISKNYIFLNEKGKIRAIEKKGIYKMNTKINKVIDLKDVPLEESKTFEYPIESAACTL